MSAHKPIHSSQMAVCGPAISFRTSCWLLPQNEQKTVSGRAGSFCVWAQEDEHASPSGGNGIGAIFRPSIESNCRAWSNLMNSVDDGLEYCKAFGRQADAGSNYNAIIAHRS